MFPAVTVNSRGRGAIGFSLAGPDHFPSLAYVPLDERGIGPIQIAGAGTAPQDGFSSIFSPINEARWGDYSTGAVAEDGSIWLATEYIPDLPRLDLANWGSFIARVPAGP